MLNGFMLSLDRFLQEDRGTWRISTWWGFDSSASLQLSLLRILAIAHENQWDIAPLVLCLADEHPGMARYRLRQFGKRIANGTPLIEALEQTPNALSDEDVLTLRFALQSGTFDAGLKSIFNRSTAQSRDFYDELKQTLFYHFCLLFLIVLLTSGVMTFIVPTFSVLYREMEIQPTLAHSYLLTAGMSIGYYLPLALVLLFFIAVGSWLLKPIQYLRRTFASRWFHAISQLRTAHLLRMLAMATEAGRPVPGSLSTLARYHFDQGIREKLLFARNEVELGTEPWHSLSVAKLLSPEESKALASSTTSRTRSWLMQRIADEKEAKISQRASILVSLVHPMLILLFGMIVLWIAAATFGTLSQLTLSLT